ncbi:MAG: 2-oxo acid dehydrogenase subunit E2 [Clostridia bacterium]|nr:2-oxo acid dehydrogenase subunit E2 [Clostridia bacterium]
MSQIKEYKGKKGFEVIKTTHFDIQRKIVANMTTESWQNIPHSAINYEPDVTDFMNYYKENIKPKGISVNSLLLKVMVEGLKACPEMNGHIDFNRRLVRGKIEIYKDINISMPMIMPNGAMMTINMHNFESRTLKEMQDYIADVKRKMEKTDMTEAMFSVSMDNTLTALKKGKFITTFGRLIGAKTGKHKVVTLKGKAKKEYNKIPKNDRIVKEDIEQGTITITSTGSVYNKGAYCGTTLIEVIPPQITAIGIGSFSDKPGVIVNENGEKVVAVRNYLPILLAFDHRALDFGEMEPFLRRLDDIFAHPEQMENW